MIIAAETLRHSGDHLEIGLKDLRILITELQELAEEAEHHNGYKATILTGSGGFNVQVLP